MYQICNICRHQPGTMGHTDTQQDGDLVSTVSGKLCVLLIAGPTAIHTHCVFWGYVDCG